jgi:hypothetical protein
MTKGPWSRITHLGENKITTWIFFVRRSGDPGGLILLAIIVTL